MADTAIRNDFERQKTSGFEEKRGRKEQTMNLTRARYILTANRPGTNPAPSFPTLIFSKPPQTGFQRFLAAFEETKSVPRTFRRLPIQLFVPQRPETGLNFDGCRFQIRGKNVFKPGPVPKQSKSKALLTSAVSDESPLKTRSERKRKPTFFKDSPGRSLKEELSRGRVEGIESDVEEEQTESAEIGEEKKWEIGGGKEASFYREPPEMCDICGEDSKMMVLKPLFKGRPYTVLFRYPPQSCKPTKLTSRAVPARTEDLEEKPMFYRYSGTAHVYNCVLRVLEYNGFTETEEDDFALYLSSDINPKVLLNFNPFQKYNHYPGSWQLGRKDNLWRNISRMKRTFGEDYNFCPQTYLLPDDLPRFHRDRDSHPDDLWIMKPAASSRGRGIRVMTSKSILKKKTGYLISAYIANPHLINGLKYDLRLYVCVPSYDPLRIYLYKEGLVRFASDEYTTAKKSVSRKFVHLTNYSINKRSRSYKFNQNAMEDCEGNKWSHSAFRRKLSSLGIDSDSVFSRIKELLIKTIMSAEPAIVSSMSQYTKIRGNCFETYGFDVLLDEEMRPWLMEVNVSPSLNSGSPLDKRIKTSLLADVYTLIGFVPYDRKRFSRDFDLLQQNKGFAGSKNRLKRPTLQAIQACKRLSELNLPETEIQMLMETEEEYSRCGDFERIFPKKENVQKLSRFLIVSRVNNQLTWKMILDDPDFLNRYRIEAGSKDVKRTDLMQ